MWKKKRFWLRVMIRYWARWVDREGQTDRQILCYLPDKLRCFEMATGSRFERYILVRFRHNGELCAQGIQFCRLSKTSWVIWKEEGVGAKFSCTPWRHVGVEVQLRSFWAVWRKGDVAGRKEFVLPSQKCLFWMGFLAESLLEIVARSVRCLPCWRTSVCPDIVSSPTFSGIIAAICRGSFS